MTENPYTLWFTFGRYDIVRIDRILGSVRAVCTVVSTGRAVTVRLKDTYGRFEYSGDARKAANEVNRIHQRHAPAVKQALTAHTEAVKNRNRDVLEYLRELNG